jgi:DNA-binding protein HU-beta
VHTSELIDHVASAPSLDKMSAVAVDTVLDEIVATLKSGDTASLLGYGVYATTSRVARQGRNPCRGAAVEIAVSKGVRSTRGSPFTGDPQRQERGQEVGPREGGQGTCECGSNLQGHGRGGQDREVALAPRLAGQRPPTKGRTPLWLP